MQCASTVWQEATNSTDVGRYSLGLSIGMHQIILGLLAFLHPHPIDNEFLATITGIRSSPSIGQALACNCQERSHSECHVQSSLCWAGSPSDIRGSPRSSTYCWRCNWHTSRPVRGHIRWSNKTSQGVQTHTQLQLNAQTAAITSAIAQQLKGWMTHDGCMWPVCHLDYRLFQSWEQD